MNRKGHSTKQQRALAEFEKLSKGIGLEMQKKGISEEEALSGLEKTQQKVFEEQYGEAFISLREKRANEALDRLGEILEENGVTLDQLIKSGRRIRGKIINEQYPHLKQTQRQVWKSRRSNSRGK